MKTTIELPDSLFLELKKVAKERGWTLREVVEAGVRHEVRRGAGQPAEPDFVLPTVRGNGLQPGVTHALHEYAYEWVGTER